MRWIYGIALCLLLPLGLLVLHRSDPSRWRQRFGRVARPPSPPEVWIHAASMGEVQAAGPLIDACLQRWGAGRVAVTTMTATGSALVQQRWGDRLVHAYLPFDLPVFLQPLLDRWQPRRCVVMESELWPNLFRALHRRRVPLLLANARMSPRSLRRYRRLGSWLGRTLQ